MQSGAVFGESPVPGARNGSAARRNYRRSLLGKAQQRQQRRTNEDFGTEGADGLARASTLPY